MGKFFTDVSDLFQNQVTQSYYENNNEQEQYNTNEQTSGNAAFGLLLLGIGVAIVIAISIIVCCCRFVCRVARNQNCSLLCRSCSKCCRSQCGSAYVSDREAILRTSEGIMENEELYKKTVQDNPIMKAVVHQISEKKRELGLEPHIVGSLREKLGKPTRVITTEYPYGLPSRSPLCTDVDVMLVSRTLLASHFTHNPYSLFVQPSIAHRGFATVLVPFHFLNNQQLMFLEGLSEVKMHLESQTSTCYLSSEKVKQSLLESLGYLNIKEIFRKTKGKFKTHKRSISVSAAGPAIKVILRQQIPTCQRCCMLGQFNFRKCCCCLQCLRDEELDVAFEGDLTFALKCSEWPGIAREWAERRRGGYWPNRALVQGIVNEGSTLVPKSEWDDGLLWRYSFSLAELRLVHSIPRPTVQVFIAIKGMMKRRNCELKSYTLKSMLFWTMEKGEKSEEFWQDANNHPEKLKYLLKAFLGIMKEGRCKNYFIREIDLLDQVSDVPAAIHILEELNAYPYDYLTSSSLEKSRYCALNTLICRLCCGCHDTDLSVDIY